MVLIQTANTPYVLGLDIGSTSIGWACLKLRNSKPYGILATGVRLFDAGMSGTSTDFDRGREESNAIARRKARLARRQLHRRAARRWAVFQLLQTAGLLPPDKVNGRHSLSAFIVALDNQLAPKFIASGNHVSAQLLVYKIRAKAASEPIEPFAFGRALLHLAKRRGFNSNLRGAPKNDDDSGVVRPAIESLANALEEKDATLGQYLSDQDPFKKGSRYQGIRRRWTGRDMYLREFDKVWETQSPFMPQLTEPLRNKLRRAIFFQRPLRSAKGLVGSCTLEPKKRRLAAAHPLAQEVRMLQFVNNVRIRKRGELDRGLSDSEREKAIAALSGCGRMTLKAFRDAISLPKGSSLNFEGDDDAHARGMGTVSELRAILGTRWDNLNSEDKDRLFYEVLSFNKRDALIRRMQSFWSFSEQQAQLLADLSLEPGYSNHSRTALEKLRSILAEKDSALGRWPTYSEARQKAYPEIDTATAPCDQLPPVIGHVANLKNPAVIRALTEVRKVVNELTRRFGKPELIRVELARNLKRSKKERKSVEELIKAQTDRRRKALAAIRKEFTNYQDRRGYDRGIEMYLLAEECNWTCPYTGEEIHNVRDLIGSNTRFDVEHIYPRRFLDDSFGNKTLCLHEENRHVKRDRLPRIAYANNPNRYSEILARVKQFRGPAAAKKLARFLAEEVPSEFSSRQLNETRYMSVAARDYLGLLFGGTVDSEGRQRVFAIAGGLTAVLRGQWRLNQILSIVDEKNRADHRQHSIDAIVVACTGMGTIERLEHAASSAWERGSSRGLPEIDPPWERFVDDCRLAVQSVLVSHRLDRRLNGPLHADTNYAVTTSSTSSNAEERAKVRKPLDGLSEKEIREDAIIDPVVRRIVQDKYQALKAMAGSAKKPKELFASPENHPRLSNKDGTFTPIHSVRVWAAAKPFEIRPGDRTRMVASTGGSNFCTRILATLDEEGNEIGWTDDPVTRLVAMRNRNKPASGGLLKFELFMHESVIMPSEDGSWALYRILNVSKGDIETRLHYDGRLRDDVKKSGDRIRIGSGALADRRFRKVEVSPTGLLSDALTGEPIELETLAKWVPTNHTRKSRKRKAR